MDITYEINELKKEKGVAILAHYYVNDEVQKIADYVGDSFYLSKIATTIPEQNILFCGVSFMGESAKILNPEKKVVMADEYADCPMAHMVDLDKLKEIKASYEDLAVVCYVNSTAEIKTFSDVCVTSSNAVQIVKSLSNKNIFFIPDNNLGRFVAQQVPEKNFIFNDGYCHVHTDIKKEEVLKAKEVFPQAKILVHPECTMDVLEIADYIGSTAGIIEYAGNSKDETFIICTEMGILYELQEKNPEKKFYLVGQRQFCANMKRITLNKVLDALKTMSPTVELEEEMRLKAYKPLQRMLELAQ